MAELKDSLNVANEIVQSISKNPLGTTLAIIGVLFLLASLLSIAYVSRSKPENIRPWSKVLIFLSLIAAIVFCAGSPAYSLWDDIKFARAEASKNLTAHAVVPYAEALSHLKDNKQASWVIRLIPYEPKDQPCLSIGRVDDRGEIIRVKQLGKPEQKFVFVADYDELRGHTVDEAVRMIGGSVAVHQHVTAIIFPWKGRKLYPANARGVLQIINVIQKTPLATIPEDKMFDLGKFLSGGEIDALGDTGLRSYTWDVYKPNYEKYCDTVHVFRCENDYAARPLMGILESDWHPLGFSRRISSGRLCDRTPWEECKISDWDKAAPSLTKEFGARVFYIENLVIDSIEGRYLIDFEDPGQRIPDLENASTE